MFLKLVGAATLLLGLAILAFAIMGHMELRSVAFSSSAASADSMPLTKILGPELFDPEKAQAKPAELAEAIFQRIYMIGGGSIIFILLGILMLATPQAIVSKRKST